MPGASVLFHSWQFSFFLATLLLCFGLTRNPTARKGLLVAANFVFVSAFSLPAAGLIIALVVSTYALALIAGSPRWGRLACGFGIPLLLAGIYAGRSLFGAPAFLTPLRASAVTLSFSFVCFPLIAFLCDRRDGKIALPPFLDFAVFSTFFATIPSGPVLRPGELLPQLDRLADEDPLRAKLAVERFTLGLFKKVILADRLGLFYENLNGLAKSGTPSLYLLMFYVYALEVYFDFSGYTDMARGIARAVGLEIPENFRQPYLAESPVDWWRRWHISLATFLRDYVYYPLFFRTKSLYLCTAVTFLLNGLWHGFGLNFFLLGVYWSAMIISYLAIRSWWETLLPRAVRIFLTLQIAVGSFVFFLPDGTRMLRAALTSPLPSLSTTLGRLTDSLDERNLAILLLGLALMAAVRKLLTATSWRFYAPSLYIIWLFLFCCGLFTIRANFIYSQF